MNYPLIILLALLLIGLGMAFAKHSERKEGHYNGWNSLTSTAIAIGLLLLALNNGCLSGQ